MQEQKSKKLKDIEVHLYCPECNKWWDDGFRPDWCKNKGHEIERMVVESDVVTKIQALINEAPKKYMSVVSKMIQEELDSLINNDNGEL